MIRPQVVFIERDTLPRVAELEELCYASPWTQAQIVAEFNKDVSMCLGLSCKGSGDEGSAEEVVISYSFSHLVEQELHILNLAVDPKYQGRGYGSFLLGQVFIHAYARGARRVFLEVRISNGRALRLYERCGFQEVGVRENYYRNNGEAALLLERGIDQSLLNCYNPVRFAQSSGRAV